jgi:hypothetical protein
MLATHGSLSQYYTSAAPCAHVLAQEPDITPAVKARRRKEEVTRRTCGACSMRSRPRGDASESGIYWLRSVVAGSTRAARRAGSQVAATATATSSTAVVALMK